MSLSLECGWFKNLNGIEYIVAEQLIVLSSKLDFIVPEEVLKKRTITRVQLKEFLQRPYMSKVASELDDKLAAHVRYQRSKSLDEKKVKASPGKKQHNLISSDKLVNIRVRAGTKNLIDRLCDATIPRHKFVEALVRDFSREEKTLITELKEQKDEELNRFKGDLAKRSELTKKLNELYNERRFLITLIGFYEGVLTELLEPKEIRNDIMPKAKCHLHPPNEDVEAALVDTSSNWHLRMFRDIDGYPVQKFIKRYFKARYKD